MSILKIRAPSTSLQSSRGLSWQLTQTPNLTQLGAGGSAAVLGSGDDGSQAMRWLASVPGRPMLACSCLHTALLPSGV